MIKRLGLTISTVFFTLLAHAQLGGQNAYTFLNTPIAPRVAGTAGAVVANTENDVNFGIWNPALINQNMHGDLSMSFSSLAGGVKFGEGVYSHTWKKAGSFNAGIKYVNYGDFKSANSQAVVTGNFSASDFAFQIGYGYQLDSNFQFGASIKLINSAYEQYSSWAIATDLAAVYQIPKSRFAMSLILRNMGTQIEKFNSEAESLPFEVKFGVSTRFKHVPLRLNLMLDNLQKMDLTYNDPNNVTTDPITGEVTVAEESIANKILRHVVIAAELTPGKRINIQLGYAFRRNYEMAIPTRRSSAGLTLGAGIKINRFFLNYANTNMNVAGRMHHFSITTSLGEFKKNK